MLCKHDVVDDNMLLSNYKDVVLVISFTTMSFLQIHLFER